MRTCWDICSELLWKDLFVREGTRRNTSLPCRGFVQCASVRDNETAVIFASDKQLELLQTASVVYVGSTLCIVENIASIRLLRLWFQITYCQHCPQFRCVNRHLFHQLFTIFAPYAYISSQILMKPLQQLLVWSSVMTSSFLDVDFTLLCLETNTHEAYAHCTN